MPVTITAFQRNAFQINAFQIAFQGAQYFLLRPHNIKGFIEQWTTVTEGVEVPLGWVPTMEVDPLNSPAVDAFYAAGPRSVENQLLQGWKQPVPSNLGTVWFRPVTFWVQIGPNTWKLTGLGAAKPPISV